MVVNIIMELLFPQGESCLVCGKSGSPRRFCRSCLEEWAALVAGMRVCRLCGRFYQVLEGEVCPDCLAETPLFSAAVSPLPYEEGVREMVHTYKYAGLRELAEPGADLMAALAVRRKEFRESDCLVSVPLHPARLRERRFDQAALLARHLSAKLRIPYAAGALERTRETPSQTGLGRGRRLTNLLGAFTISRSAALAGKAVVLVDDVFTTGATAAECSRTLLAGGARRVLVITLATSVVRLAPDAPPPGSN